MWTSVIGMDVSAQERSGSDAEGRRVARQALDARAVYGAVRPILERFVQGMGIRPADADDVVQEAFVQLLPRLSMLREEADARRYLIRVVANRCVLLHRQRSRWGRVVEALTGGRGRAVASESSGGPAEVPARGAEAALPGSPQEVSAVREALACLPAREHAVLVLHYHCGLTSEEIAVVLDVPASTVRTRMIAGRNRLADRLGKDRGRP